MLLFIVFCGATYYFGARTEICKTDPERKRRFKSRCVNNLIWSLFLVRSATPRCAVRGGRDTRRRNTRAWLRRFVTHASAIPQVYPQVSATTLQIFSCVELEDGTAWLTADLREQCWRVHAAAACKRRDAFMSAS
jgi:hypothetical protein